MERINENIFNENNAAEKNADGKAAGEAQKVEASKKAFDKREDLEKGFDEIGRAHV